jgi:GH15 family glucan-1,4-alpha-glucosidase
MDVVDGAARRLRRRLPDLVRRSSLVLQGLTYGPSARSSRRPTTSLPETMGGELNFDYRYAWLRDLSLTMRSLWLAACPDEPARLFAWLAAAPGTSATSSSRSCTASRASATSREHVLEHLAATAAAHPVRVGNAGVGAGAARRVGEVLDAAHLLRTRSGSSRPPTQQLLVSLAHRAAATWQEPDAGMWEARDERRHYTSPR